VLIFTFPFMLWFWKSKRILLSLIALQCILFGFVLFFPPSDPASDPKLTQAKQTALRSGAKESWDFDLQYLSPYARLNLLLRQKVLQAQDASLRKWTGEEQLQTLWQQQTNYELNASDPNYIKDFRAWVNQELPKVKYAFFPLLSHFHWEDDAGGDAALNQKIPWWKLTRINHKDLLAALIFGVRISLVVGLLAVAIALAIGIPIGAYAGYYGGTFDIIVSRLLEIWESMPTFFMLLLIVAVTQSKSIFIVILVIGFFGWTGFSRYIRGEFFKQRNLPYVEACHSLGFRDNFIMFSHILPNAIPPLLTLLPFAIMGAISSEAGLSFLGLGEENSGSWGVLMDEGRTAFPAQSYLLWPPAIALTILLIAIALVGDALRDTLDPRTH
jgi:peptide/nickel transport system permease protein